MSEVPVAGRTPRGNSVGHRGRGRPRTFFSLISHLQYLLSAVSSIHYSLEPLKHNWGETMRGLAEIDRMFLFRVFALEWAVSLWAFLLRVESKRENSEQIILPATWGRLSGITPQATIRSETMGVFFSKSDAITLRKVLAAFLSTVTTRMLTKSPGPLVEPTAMSRCASTWSRTKIIYHRKDSGCTRMGYKFQTLCSVPHFRMVMRTPRASC